MSLEFREQVQNEAYRALMSKDRASGDISVRLGKTLIGLKITQNFSKVLISYPNESIKSAWINDSLKFNINLDNCIFTTHLSLSKYNLEDFDCIILDEVDTVSEAQWQWIEKYNPKVIKGLSGTMPKKGIKKDYINIYCPIVYTKKLDETTNITSKDYTIFVHLLNPSTEKNLPLSKGRFWSEKAKIDFWEKKYQSSRNFMDMLKVIQSIQNSPTKFKYLKQLSNKIDRCLIFLETQKQCDELGYISYHSGNKQELNEINLNLFNNLQGVNKLSCVKQLSAGIQFPNLSKAIILHTYASNNKFAQRFGRILSLVDNPEKEAEVHILCLKGTKDEVWTATALEEFNPEKIKYINV